MSGSRIIPVDGAAGVASLRTLGTGANQALPGNTSFATSADVAAEATARAAADTTETNARTAADAAHAALTTSAHGGIVASTDARLSDQRTPTDGSVTNAKVAVNAAIAYSKLNLTGAIQNADLAGSIAYSKLSLTGAIQNSDIAASAGIPYSKLSLAGSILNTDLAGSIAYSKLTLTGSVVNADISSGAAIAYSKLNLTGNIVNADIASGAAIAYPKLALAGAIQNTDLAGGIDPAKITGTAVVTSDSRLSDARTPTAHAASHAPFGSDDLMLYRELSTRLDWYPRPLLSGTLSMTPGVVYYAYFTPRRSFTVSRIGFICSTAGSGATLVRAGLCSVDASYNVTALAHTDNVATWLNSTGAIDQPLSSNNLDGTAGSWPTTVNLVAGTTYAVTLVSVGHSVSPVVRALSLTSFGASQAPPYSAQKSAQTDLQGGNASPGTQVLYSSLGSSSNPIGGYFV